MTISSIRAGQPMNYFPIQELKRVEQDRQEAIRSLTDHLRELIPLNPLVVKDMLDKFQEIVDEIFVPREGILGKFEELSLSEETREFLNDLDASFKQAAESSELDTIIENMRNDLSNIPQQLRKQTEETEKELWGELNVFLQLKEIRRFSTEQMRQVREAVSERIGYRQLQELITGFLGHDKEIIHALETDLNQQLYRQGKIKTMEKGWNFHTLCKQVMISRPKEAEGIVSNWNAQREFFRDRMITISDRDSNTHFTGTIIESNQPSDSIRSFSLDNGKEITITKPPPDGLSWTVVIRQTEKQSLWKIISLGECPGEKVMIELIDSELQLPQEQSQVYYKSIRCNDLPNIIREIWMEEKGVGDEVMQLDFAYLSGEIYTIFLMVQQTLSRIELLEAYFCHPNFSNCEEILVSELDRIFVVSRVDKTIKLRNIEQSMKITKGNLNEFQKRERYAKEVEKRIQEKESEARNELLNQPKHLNEILDSFIENTCVCIEEQVIQKNHQMTDWLKTLSEEYKKLDIQRSAQDILRGIVLEANYSRIIKKTKNLEVAKIMRFIKDALDHATNIQKKPASLFIGNTGSGKSTMVGFLLGAKLTKKGNRFVYKNPQLTRLPKIGHSFSLSETVYTTGYFPPDTNISLVDCPGFCDTRGREQDLCTNLSIDRTIEKIQAITSLVVVIPLNVFDQNRGNDIVYLVNTVREKFPFAFTNDEKNERVFLLITMNDKMADPVDEKGIGRIIDAALQDISSKLDECQPDDVRTRNLEYRQQIWWALQSMYGNQQIDLFDNLDDTQQDHLLKKYTVTCPNGMKGSYEPTMQNRKMQDMLGRFIEMSTDTWDKHILRKFLDEIPQAIRRGEQTMEELESSLKRKENEFGQNSSEKETLQKKLQDLEKLKENSKGVGFFFSSFISSDQSDEVNQARKERKEALERDIEKYLQEIHQLNNDRGRLLKESQVLSKELKDKDMDKTLLNTTLHQLITKGSHKEVLWQFKWNEDDELHLREWKMTKGFWKWKKSIDGRLEAFQRGEKSIRKFLNGKKSKVKASEYKGEIHDVAFISRNYKIVPGKEIDQRAKKAFEDAIKQDQLTTSAGAYEVTLEGKKFRCDLGMMAEPNGKGVRYGFITDWDGQPPLPEITITHTIPNSEYDEATIINREAELKALKKQIDKLKQAIREKENRNESIQKDIDKKRIDLNDCKVRLSTLMEENKKATQEQIEGLIKEYRSSIENLEMRERDLQERIEKLKKDIQSEQERMQSNVQERRHLALIILSEWETGVLLEELANKVLQDDKKIKEKGKQGESETITYKQSVIEACRSFLRIYQNAQANGIEQECLALLGLSTRDRLSTTRTPIGNLQQNSRSEPPSSRPLTGKTGKFPPSLEEKGWENEEDWENRGSFRLRPHPAMSSTGTLRKRR